MARIPLDGCLNFRDLGGYPTAGGGRVRNALLYRSDALHLLSPADVAILRDQLAIADILDLRSTGELQTEGRGPLAEESMRFHHIPLFDGDTSVGRQQANDVSLADRYFLLAQFARTPIARVLTVLANTDSPAVYHCAAGKDRTGVISAILLGLLDVEDDVIVADYVLSAENIDAIMARLLESEGYQEMLAALPPETMHANPETMSGFLAHLRTSYGTMDEYARTAGVESDAIARLRERLIEPS